MQASRSPYWAFAQLQIVSGVAVGIIYGNKQCVWKLVGLDFLIQVLCCTAVIAREVDRKEELPRTWIYYVIRQMPAKRLATEFRRLEGAPPLRTAHSDCDYNHYIDRLPRYGVLLRTSYSLVCIS